MRFKVLIVLLTISQLALAQTREQKIKNLLEMLGSISLYEQQMEESRVQIREWGKLQFKKSLTNLEPSPEFKEKFDRSFAKYLDTALTPLGTEQLNDAWSQAYAEKFTDAELDQLMAFYTSKIGQRDIVVSHEAYTEFYSYVANVSRSSIDKAVNDFSEELKQLIKDCNCKKSRKLSYKKNGSEKSDDLDILLDDARRLRDEKQFEASLSKYLEFFNKTQNTSYTGVRLSYVPSELIEMAKEYPAARTALEVMRDKRERIIKQGRPTQDDIHEWSSLSEYLDGNEYILDYFDQAKNTGSLDYFILSSILELNWDHFVKSKRYTDVKTLAYSKLGDLGMMMKSLSEYVDNKQDVEINNSMTEFYAREYGRVYEILLATYDDDTANGLADTLLNAFKNGTMYRALIQSAKNAGRDSVSDILLSEAETALSPEELKIVIEGKPKDMECEGPNNHTD